MDKDVKVLTIPYSKRRYKNHSRYEVESFLDNPRIVARIRVRDVRSKSTIIGVYINLVGNVLIAVMPPSIANSASPPDLADMTRDALNAFCTVNRTFCKKYETHQMPEILNISFNHNIALLHRKKGVTIPLTGEVYFSFMGRSATASFLFNIGNRKFSLPTCFTWGGEETPCWVLKPAHTNTREHLEKEIIKRWRLLSK